MNITNWLAAIPWLDQAFCVRFAQTLFHFLWQGLAVGALLFLITRSLNRRSAHVRYMVNVAGLLLMSACLPATFAFLLPTETQTLGSAVVPGGVSNSSPGSAIILGRTAVTADRHDETESSNVEVSGATADSMAEPGDAKSYNTTRLLSSLAPNATAAYLLGLSIMLLRLGRGLWSAQRLQRLATLVKDPHVVGVLQTQAHRIGMKAAPAVAYCERVALPVVVGILKPTILLPSSLASAFAPDQLEAIRTHELAHIRRFDLLVNLLQRVVESVLFFHPAVWYVSRQASTEREHCSDDFVLLSGCQRMQYADALIRMAELCNGVRGSGTAKQLATLAATGGSPSQLRQRIMRVFGDEQRPSLRVTRAGVLMLALLIISIAFTPVVLRNWSQAQKPDSATENVIRAGQRGAASDARSFDKAAANPNEAIVCLAFSPDGRLLAGGMSHKRVQVWAAANGMLLKTLEGHPAPVEGLCFSPNGRKLYRASKDIKVWDVAPDSTLVARSDDATLVVRHLNNRFASWTRFADSPFRKANRPRNAADLLKRRDPSKETRKAASRRVDVEQEFAESQIPGAVNPSARQPASSTEEGGYPYYTGRAPRDFLPENPAATQAEVIEEVSPTVVEPSEDEADRVIKPDKPATPTEDEARAAFKKAGIYVEISSSKGGFFRAGPGNEFMSLRFRGTKVTDEWMRYLLAFQETTSLRFSESTQITDESLKIIGQLRKLRSLRLASSQITGSGLKHLANCSKLTSLTVKSRKLGDKELSQLGSLAKLNLVDLTIGGWQSGDAGLAQVGKMKSLESLTLHVGQTADGRAIARF